MNDTLFLAQSILKTTRSSLGKISHFILELAASLMAQRDRQEPACDAGDTGLVPELGRSSGEGNGNPLQYSYLENPMDRGTWRATVQGVARSCT